MNDEVVLGNICEFINGGAWSDKEYTSNGIPVLKVSNFKPSGFSLENICYLPERSLEKYSKNILQTDDLVIATVGSHPNLINSAAGRACIITGLVDGYLLNQNAVCIRTTDSSILDQRYLNNIGRSYDFQHYIQSRGRGAANQMRIAISAIKEYKFNLPDIAKQRHVAGIISAYDDIIENNQKQIALLEEATMRLYKEWFVYLRFPGHDNTRIVDGVPEGWEKAPTSEYIKFNYGKALQEDKRRGDKYPVYGSSGIVGYHNAYLIEAPVIIVGRKGNVGSVYWSYENAFPIDTVYYITTSINPYYVYFELLTRSFVNSDSAVPGLNRTYAEAMEMVCPCESILTTFENQVSPLLMLQYKLEQQIKNTQQARDMLLPKLISGELEV